MVGVTRLVDLDIVVIGDGLAFAREAARALHASLTAHEQFGTATLALPGGRAAPLRLDVATARKERYTAPAAYPKVTPGTLREDLFRRDFTINAMAMGIGPKAFGRLVDPFGGARDVRAKRLRVLHKDSFLDDPSRILRAVRFVERFGLTLEPVTARALRRAVEEGLLARLNRGRLRKELERITQEPDPMACLERLGRWLAA
jgi:tRNA nucleotidyltransferase (CCA-adding enzyme)